MMIRILVCSAMLLVAGTASGETPADRFIVPPSPFNDVHGVYDSGSQCWIWDRARKVAMTQTSDVVVHIDSKCAGAPLNGPAKMTWITGGHHDEVWDGSFTNGKFTGIVTFTFDGDVARIGYRDGIRSGVAIQTFRDGGRSEHHYADDLFDGPYLEVYSDGSRIQGQYEKGKLVGLWVRTQRDGSRQLSGLHGEPQSFDMPQTYVTPEGKTLPGIFKKAQIDEAASPRLEYPKISLRLSEQGEATVSFHAMADGTVQDLKLIRSSGTDRLDAALIAYVTTAHFTPATLDGKPMPSFVILTRTFHIRDSP